MTRALESGAYERCAIAEYRLGEGVARLKYSGPSGMRLSGERSSFSIPARVTNIFLFSAAPLSAPLPDKDEDRRRADDEQEAHQ